ncbi:MAG: hypothetical protein QG611_1214 [Bacteroidota bacterium]|nr:hypothetical protein [Bacteroidota bacterium]
MFLVMPLMLFSCESIPEAQFSADTLKPELGQDVYFTNESHNAVEFNWDFGDGYGSNDENPVHTYTGTGVFDVVMTAISGKGLEDKATMTIEVIIPTLLEIQVLDYETEEPVPGISVWLYSKLSDWQAGENDEAEGYTDDNGFVVFSHLGPWVYYVDVYSDDYDNYAIYNDLGVDWIRTDEIIKNRINWFTAYVDYKGTSKGATRDQKSLVIKRIERKVIDRNQRPVTMDSWQTLYNKSIKVK